MTKIIELVWDCSYCHTKNIQGHEYICPNCGRRRGEETKFYRPDVDVVVEKPIDKRPDWYCDSCGSYNKAADLNCHSCGAPHSTETYFDVQKRLKKKEETATYHIAEQIPVFDDGKNVDDEQTPSYESTVKSTVCAPTKQSRSIALGIAIFLGIIIGVILLWPKCKTITIQQTAWTRSIQIEQNTLVEEDNWELPDDAVELLYTRQEIHHYDHVIDHYETVTEWKTREVFDGYEITYTYRDLGNGYAECEEHPTPRYRTESYPDTHEEPVYRDEPVYKTKYYYKIWRYKYHHSVIASGNSDTEGATVPNWPTYRLVGDQREGARAENYTVTATDKKGKKRNYDVDYDIWVQLEPNQTYNIKLSFGRITKIVH